VLAVEPAIVEQGGELHAGELAAREHPVGVLHRGHRDVAPFHAGVGAAFDEVHARDRGQAHEVIHGVDLRLLHHAHHHEAMLVRVDVPPALVVALEVQAVGGDDAEQALQRRERDRSGADAREAGALAALEVLLVFRRHPVGARHHGLSKALAVLGQVEDRGIAFRGLGRGLARGDGGGGEEGAAQEFPASRLHFGDLPGVEEMLGSLLQAAREIHGRKFINRG
jgi:hypothetical protein